MNHLLLAFNNKLSNGWIFHDSVFLYFFLYACLCLIVAALLLKSLPKRYLKNDTNQKQYISIFIFFWSICFAIPLLGIFYSILLLTVIKRQRVKELNTNFLSACYPEFKQEKFYFGRKYDQGGAFNIATNKRMDAQVRLRSLVNLNNSSSKLTQTINKILIQERVDDIRLYAYVLMEKKRNEIDSAVDLIQSLIKRTDNPVKLSRLNKWLAESYWQYIYFGLLDDISATQIKAIVQRYAEQALTVRPYANLYKILGLIAMSNHHFQEAETFFQRSCETSRSNYFVLPFQAETAYLQHKYQDLKILLCSTHRHTDNAVLKLSKQFWCPQNDN